MCNSLASHIAPGSEIDHFRVIRLLGHGGMGEVYLARDTKLGRKVAIKLVLPSVLGTPQAVQRFLSEAQVTARFSHPNIVTLYAVGEYEGVPYVALEYLEGGTLRDRMTDGQLGAKEILRVGIAIADALGEAHAHKVLHRDLKPENVLLPRDGRLRVVDFGLAKTLTTQETSMSLRERDAPRESMLGGDTLAQAQPSDGGLAGTPMYMAPEQWAMAACTQATDIWALGVILYELIAGAHPYWHRGLMGVMAFMRSPDPTPPAEPAVPIPSDVLELVALCLSKDPTRRPSAAHVVGALRGVVDRDRPLRDAEPSPFRGLLPFTERHAEVFFGRDPEIAAFLEQMRDVPTLSIVGPSGAGKSSFVLSGVVPRLREQGRWTVLLMRPGIDPLATLADRLVRGDSRRSPGGRGIAATGTVLPERRTDPKQLAAQLREAPASLALHLQAIAEESDSHVLLVVDQLEEVYTLARNPRERRCFMEAICSAADDPLSPVRVIFTVRDDFLARVAEGDVARRALSRVTVLRTPDVGELEDILRRPVELAGFAFEDPEMVAEIASSLRDEPAALALVQLGGQALWDRRDKERKLLTRHAYEGLGGMEGALVLQADRVLEGLTAEEIGLARELFLRLVTKEETRRVVDRDRLLDGLDTRAADVLDRLIRDRALVVRRGVVSGEVEIVHESLIRAWARLRRWLEESREDRVFLEEVSQAAELWASRSKRDDELWRGLALQEAQRRRANLRNVPGIVDAFLQSGSTADRRRSRRRRLAAASVMCALALVAIVFAWQNREVRRQSGAVDEQRRIAEREKAEALREGGKAAMSAGDLLESRAKLRLAMEVGDSTSARALWWRLSGERELWRFRTMMNHDVVWSPDGQTLAATIGGPISLLDPATGTSTITLQGPDELFFSVDFSPDGHLLAAAGSEVSLWDVQTHEKVAVLDTTPQYAESVRFSPDAKSVAANSRAHGVRIYDTARRALRHQLPVRDADLAFSSDGGLLIAGSADGNVRAYDTMTGSAVGEALHSDSPVRSVNVSRDGRHWLIGGDDGTLRLWDVVARRDRILGQGHTGPIVALDSDPRSERVASGGKDGTVLLWDLANPGLPEHLLDAKKEVSTIAFSPDGSALVTGFLDGEVIAWDMRVKRQHPRPLGHDSLWLRAAISDDARFVISASFMEPEMWAWDGRDGSPIRQVKQLDASVAALAFAPGEYEFAAACSDGAVRVWDAAEGSAVAVLFGHKAAVTAVAFSRDGTWLASGSKDGTVRVWERAGWTLHHELRGHADAVRALTFRRDGSELASSGMDGTVRLWDTVKGRQRKVLSAGRARSAWGLAYEPHGGGLVVGMPKELRRFDTQTSHSTPIHQYDKTHPASFNAVQYSSSGHLLGASLGDALPRIVWDAKTRRELWSFTNTLGPGSVFAISENDDVIVTEDAASLRLWSARDGHALWRGTILLPDPPMALTHRGWLDMKTGQATQARPSPWLELLEKRTRLGAADPSGHTLCLITYDEELQLWDRDGNAQAAKRTVPAHAEVLGIQDGCVVSHESKVGLLRRDGEYLALSEDGQGTSTHENEIFVATQKEFVVFDAQGRETRRDKVPSGVTRAIAPIPGGVAVGGFDGSVTLLLLQPDGTVAARPLLDTHHISVEQIVAGPGATLVVLYTSGFIGLWNTESCELLDGLKLHGRPIHHALLDGVLYVSTNVGDHGSVDLSVFERDYCDVLREMWSQVPVVWSSGRAEARDAPLGHPCAAPLGSAASASMLPSPDVRRLSSK